MKQCHFFKQVVVVFFLLTTGGILSAQNFTVSVPSTDDYSGYFVPVKPGASFQFHVSVINNLGMADTISIDKTLVGMGEVHSWVSIDDNKLTAQPSGGKVDFLLTVNVPANAENRNYTLYLNFTAVDTANNQYDFSYNQQTIIVDKTPPTKISFHVTSASTKLTFYSFSAWDARSKQYTDLNVGAGANGIKSFTITLKDGSNVIGSNSFNAAGSASVTFNYLSSNKNYTASVKATDMAGNSTTKDSIVGTAPAKPTNLTFSNTTYISTVLSWTPSPGATGYNVYLFDGSKNTLLNSTPITTNSYTINDLKPDTTYSFHVRALSNAGISDWSDKASVKTLALPYITGPSLVCTGNYTFTLSSLVSGYSVSWSSSANLHLSSTSGISAIFSVVSTGQGQINASITAPSGKVLNLTNKAVWVGVPSFYIYGDNDLMPNQPGMAVIYQNGTSVGMIESWSYYGPLRYFKGDISKARYRAGTQSGNGFIYATVRNTCGAIENRMYYVVESFYNVYPNPADNVLSVESASSNKTISSNTNLNNKTATATINTASSPTEIRLYDKMMHLVLKKTFNGAKTKINVSNFRPGIYILQVIKGENIYKKEVIISHH